MSARSDDRSRSEHREASTRNTARDVPAAKFKEGSVGTVAPRGLRGPSLLPGQGAPERINPEEVELAVLRDAETLDGPHLARATQKRIAEPRSPSPTPVSVEVPRVRSMPPSQGEYASTPPSPSARSIQSGTLMSIGSVDPRAPTELSLPGPRPLSVSERAVYLGPEAVVDRTPSASPRELPGVVESSRYLDSTLRPGAPSSESRRSSSAADAPSSRATASPSPSFKVDSVAPAAQKFARAPHSYAPISPRPESVRDSRPALSSRSGAPGSRAEGPQFQIHAQLDAVRHELREDSFDLRSVSTQREPLAGRKQLPSSDWTPHGPVSEAGFSPNRAPLSSSRQSNPGAFDIEPPIAERAESPRASVPVSWVLGAAAFAVLLALIVAWALRPTSGAQDIAVPGSSDVRSSGAAPSSASQPAPETPTPAQQGAASQPRGKPGLTPTAAGAAAASSRSLAKASGSRTASSAAAEPGSKALLPAPAAADSSNSASKSRQSIY